LREKFQFSCEVELTVLEGLPESCHEFAAKDFP